MKKVLAVTAVLALSTLAYGQTWNEQGDAPQLPPGQATGTPGTPLTAITGTVSSSTDADLYWIEIFDPNNFRASTVGTPGTLSDTQLFLFRFSDGMGSQHEDDATGTLRSMLGDELPPLFGAGKYLLAITGYNVDPTSAGGLIWQNTPFRSERRPDGPGAAQGLSGWQGTSGTGTYTIQLQGVYASPEPGSLALMSLGALALLRRR